MIRKSVNYCNVPILFILHLGLIITWDVIITKIQNIKIQGIVGHMSRITLSH